MTETMSNLSNEPVVRINDSKHDLDDRLNEKLPENLNSIPYNERYRQYLKRNVQRNTAPIKPHTEVEILRKPSQGKPETEEGNDDRETVNSPYPGVDDGFFNGNKNNSNNNNPDAENIPLMPKPPDNSQPHSSEDEPGNVPGSGKDEPDIGKPHFPGGEEPHWPNYNPSEKPSSFPGFRPDIEIGTIPEPLPDINVYQHKKTLAQGMMDLALFSANANQLRYVLESFDRHPYYYPSLVLLSLSLIFQVGVGIGLIWNSHYNVKDKREICIANRLNNYTVIGIFLVTVINVFISAFGVANAPSTNR